jgi:hypothetical protein
MYYLAFLFRMCYNIHQLESKFDLFSTRSVHFKRFNHERRPEPDHRPLWRRLQADSEQAHAAWKVCRTDDTPTSSSRHKWHVHSQCTDAVVLPASSDADHRRQDQHRSADAHMRRDAHVWRLESPHSGLNPPYREPPGFGRAVSIL